MRSNRLVSCSEKRGTFVFDSVIQKLFSPHPPDPLLPTNSVSVVWNWQVARPNLRGEGEPVCMNVKACRSQMQIDHSVGQHHAFDPFGVDRAVGELFRCQHGSEKASRGVDAFDTQFIKSTDHRCDGLLACWLMHNQFADH